MLRFYRIGPLAKMLDFEKRVLIGWLPNTVREPVNQDVYLKIQHFCFYVKVVYHFRPEYIIMAYTVQDKFILSCALNNQQR